MFAGLNIIASDLPEINLLFNEFDCISICKDDKASLKSEINRLTNLNIKKSNNKYQSYLGNINQKNFMQLMRT